MNTLFGSLGNVTPATRNNQKSFHSRSGKSPTIMASSHQQHHHFSNPPATSKRPMCVVVTLLFFLCFAGGVTGLLQGLAPPIKNVSTSPMSTGAHPTSISEYFFGTKCVFAALILMASIAGVLVPSITLIMWGRNRVRHARRLSDSDANSVEAESPLAAVGTLLSLSNCFSGGLLVGMGLLHFIPEGYEGAVLILPSGMNWGHHDHHHHAGEGNHPPRELPPPGWLTYIGGTAESATLFFLLVGIGIPVLIDRAVNWLTAAPSCGDHSHGGTFLDALDREGGKTTTTRAEGEGAHPHSPAIDKKQPRSTATTLILLAALLSFHGTTEGLVIGSTVETATITANTLVLPLITNPLLSLILPMTLHKFFDALVLGIPVAEETKRRLEEAMLLDVHHVSMRACCRRILGKTTVLITMLSTPVVILATTMITLNMGGTSGGSGESNSSSGGGNTTSKSAQNDGNSLQVLSFASKVVGAGTFLYIGIAEIMVSELRGIWFTWHHKTLLSSLALLLPKLGCIGAGMIVVEIMGWLFPHQHSS